MISNDSDAASRKRMITERLDQLSTLQLQAVETFLDELLAKTQSESLSTHKKQDREQGSKSSHESVNPNWNAWQEIFEEADQLPASEPTEVGLSKKQRREVISADLERKFDSMSKTCQKDAV